MSIILIKIFMNIDTRLILVKINLAGKKLAFSKIALVATTSFYKVNRTKNSERLVNLLY